MFKKLAVAGAISALTTGAVMAQNSVTAQHGVSIYGTVDSGVRYESQANAAGDSRIRAVSGAQSNSRLGFRGVEDLGNGLKAKFQLETGFSINPGTTSQNGSSGTVLFDRFAWVGLESKTLGEIQLGRNTNAGNDFLAMRIVDPLGGALDGTGTPVNVANGSALRVNQALYGVASTNGLRNSRSDGMIKYIKRFGPVGVRAGYAPGGVTGDTGLRSSYNLGLSFHEKAFNAGISTLKATDAADKEMTNLSYGGNFTLGKATLTAARHEVKTDAGYVGANLTTTSSYLGPVLGTNANTGPSTEANINIVGVRYQATSKLSTTLAYYDGDYKNGTGSEGTYKSLVLWNQYDLSKRTNLYAAVDHGKSDGALKSASVSGTNLGVTVGIRHTF
jgi:predicted porin